GLQRSQVRELWSVRTKVLVRLPREQREVAVFTLGISAPVAAANFIPDPPQLVWLRYRQRLQQHLMDQRKDCRRRSNAQCQRDHSRRCKSWCLPQLPQRLTQIRQHFSSIQVSAVFVRSPNNGSTIAAVPQTKIFLTIKDLGE